MDRRSWLGVGLLITAGIVAAWGWRTLTTGYIGVPIGSFAIPYFVSLCVGVLLVRAVPKLADPRPAARIRRALWRATSVAVALGVLATALALA